MSEEQKPEPVVDWSAPRKGKKSVATVDVKFLGETFQIPKDRKHWDWRWTEALAEGRNPQAMKWLLGAEQYVKFEKLADDLEDFNAFFEVAQEAVGGNS